MRRARLCELSQDHWLKVQSIKGIKRLNGEIKRCAEVIGIFPHEKAIKRLAVMRVVAALAVAA